MKLIHGRILFLCCLLLSPQSHGKASDHPSALTDLAALSIQDKGIKKLKSLLGQYRGTRQEPDLLMRLSDLYLERSGISFRISEGTSITARSPLYTQSLKEASHSLSELINKYPQYPQIAHAIFKRGKAYKEMGLIESSKKDYLELRQNHSDFEFLDSALMDLADYNQDANQHAEALIYLAQIEKLTGSDYHAIALHKSAWSYFNLNQFEPAIQLLKKEIEFYSTPLKKNNQNQVAETAFVETAFHDLALFHFEAINKKSGVTSVEKALELFKSLDPKGLYYGKTVLNFAKLLKAYTLSADLEKLNSKLIKNDHDLPETVDIALLVYQFHFERREWNEIMPLIYDLRSIKSEKTNAKIEQTLTNSLAELHKLVLKNKLATERGTLLRPLVMLTETTSELLHPNHPTALLAQYSLAETFFELGEYHDATERYQKLMTPENLATLSSRNLSEATLTLRMLSSRYQELKKQDLIPDHLKVQKMGSPVNPASQDQVRDMAQWIQWVTVSDALKPSLEEKNSFNTFKLEADKLTYLYFNRETAVKNMIQFGKQNPESPEGVNALSIAMDTYALSESWNQVVDLSQEISKLTHLKSKTFKSSVLEMGASAYLKITQNTTDPKVALARTEECISEYNDPKILIECKLIRVKNLVKIQDFSRAIIEINPLLDKTPDPKRKQSLLLLRADAAAKLGRMDSVMNDLLAYQESTDFQDHEITLKILNYRWSKDSGRFASLLKNNQMCKGKAADSCDQYRLILSLDQDQGVDYSKAFRNTLKAGKEAQAIWALLALKNPKKLPFQDRLILLQRLGQSWDNLNPLQQIHLFPKLVSRLRDTFESIRISSPGIAPLRSDQGSIEKRMRLMQEVDLSFSKVMKLNWIEIKRNGVDELEQIYARLLSDLKAIQTPADLLVPFQQKIAELKTAGSRLDQMAFQFKPAPGNPLLSVEAKSIIPEILWPEWTKAVESKHRDYLFYLVGTLDSKSQSPNSAVLILRGLILAEWGAPTEAYALIDSAENSPWKTLVSQQFQRSKP